MRPLAVMLLTAIGGVIGFVGFRELSRRRRLRGAVPQESNSGAVVIPNESESPVTYDRQNSSQILRPRMPDNQTFVRVLFEFLVFIISILLAWVVSPGDQQILVLLHMVMIWMSLRSVGVSLPAVSEHDDDRLSLAPPSNSKDEPNFDGDADSRNPILFLGRPPRTCSDLFLWVEPMSATLKLNIHSAVFHYWTFFGSEFMPKLTPSVLDRREISSGEYLIRRKILFQLSAPYFIRSALGGVSNVEIEERSVWNPKGLTLLIHCTNVSSREYVTVKDICQIEKHHTNPDWTCVTRQVCYKVSESVGMLRTSLETLIRTMIKKKAQEFAVKFENHLEKSQTCCDPNNVLSLIGTPQNL